MSGYGGNLGNVDAADHPSPSSSPPDQDVKDEPLKTVGDSWRCIVKLLKSRLELWNRSGIFAAHFDCPTTVYTALFRGLCHPAREGNRSAAPGNGTYGGYPGLSPTLADVPTNAAALDRRPHIRYKPCAQRSSSMATAHPIGWPARVHLPDTIPGPLAHASVSSHLPSSAPPANRASWCTFLRLWNVFCVKRTLWQIISESPLIL